MNKIKFPDDSVGKGSSIVTVVAWVTSVWRGSYPWPVNFCKPQAWKDKKDEQENIKQEIYMFKR